MTLKENIELIKDYFRGIDYYNDALIVKASFPSQLTPIANEELGIKVTKSEDGLYYYYADKNKVEIEDIFSLIQNTVSVYEEARKKATLFKAKCEELKELFGVNSLEKMETLYFAFSKPTTINKVREKRKYTRKKKEENNENETVNAAE